MVYCSSMLFKIVWGQELQTLKLTGLFGLAPVSSRGCLAVSVDGGWADRGKVLFLKVANRHQLNASPRPPCALAINWLLTMELLTQVASFTRKARPPQFVTRSFSNEFPTHSDPGKG